MSLLPLNDSQMCVTPSDGLGRASVSCWVHGQGSASTGPHLGQFFAVFSGLLPVGRGRAMENIPSFKRWNGLESDWAVLPSSLQTQA